MKWIKAGLFGLVALFLFSVVMVFISSRVKGADEGKLGYIDSSRLRAEYKEFEDAQQKLDKDAKEWEEELKNLKKEVDSLKSEYEKQKLLLGEEKRKDKEKNIDLAQSKYQNYADEVWGPNGKWEARNAQLTKPILDKIFLVVEKIATQNNYAFIFDSVKGNVVYAKKSLDLTDQVLDELKKLQ
jgi:outer membrane protein